VRLPAGDGLDVSQRGALGPAEQLDDLRLLAALARRGGLGFGGGLLPRAAAFRHALGALWRGGGLQSLDGLPDPGDRRLAVGELLDGLQLAERRRAGEAVPDLGEFIAAHALDQLFEFLLARKSVDVLARRDFLGGGIDGDVVVAIDGEDAHS